MQYIQSGVDARPTTANAASKGTRARALTRSENDRSEAAARRQGAHTPQTARGEAAAKRNAANAKGFDGVASRVARRRSCRAAASGVSSSPGCCNVIFYVAKTYVEKMSIISFFQVNEEYKSDIEFFCF